MTKKQKQRAAVAAAMTILAHAAKRLDRAPETAETEAAKLGVREGYPYQAGYLKAACESSAKHVQSALHELRDAFPDIDIGPDSDPVATKGAA